MSSCINRRKLVPERVDRGGTLRYAWLRAPPLRHAIKIKPKPQLGCLTQEAPYEGGQIGIGGSLTTPPTGSPEAVARPAPTERGARISRTTLFGSWFTAFTAICSSFVSTVG